MWYDNAGPTVDDAMDCVSKEAEASAYLAVEVAVTGVGSAAERLASKLAREMPPGNLGRRVNENEAGDARKEGVLG